MQLRVGRARENSMKTVIRKALKSASAIWPPSLPSRHVPSRPPPSVRGLFARFVQQVIVSRARTRVRGQDVLRVCARAHATHSTTIMTMAIIIIIINIMIAITTGLVEYVRVMYGRVMGYRAVATRDWRGEMTKKKKNVCPEPVSRDSRRQTGRRR